MTKGEALKLYESGFWKEMSYKSRAIFQIFEDRLCMPFDVFHEAVEKTIKRPVFTHEFAVNREGIKAELLKGKKAPTLKEIIEMIPKDKKILIVEQ